MVYDGIRVPAENVLGAGNAGLAVAQERLGPARLTHCMRFVGMADRALDVAKAYMSERTVFADPLVEKQALRFDISDAEMCLHAARTMVRHPARTLPADGEARVEVAMSKMFAAETTQEIVDTCVQVCGSNGIGEDLPLADFYENVRAFRIVDRADEVHPRSVTKRALDEDEIHPEELDYLTRFREELSVGGEQ